MVDKGAILNAVFGAWLGTVSFVGVRLIKTLDSRAGRAELALALEKINEHEERATIGRQKVYDKLEQLAVAVARLEERVK